jgi:DNA-binding MarR family transcriptional regulator
MKRVMKTKKKKSVVSDEGYRTLAAFRHALRQFIAFSEDAARSHGLPPQQHQALLAIKGNPDGGNMSVGDLAGLLLIRHHSAVELIDRLVRAKLVMRAQDKADGRRVIVKLTPKAEKTLAELSVAHLAELKRNGPLLVELVERLGLS